jgi:DNA-binding SARP family transcriptional activator/TolB-like protein/Tfp pilus assembly protein PilF
MNWAPPPAAHLWLLGAFRLRTPEGMDAAPRSVKARAMIAHLAVTPGGAADRGRLSGLLWSESADAKANLRQCIKEAHRAFATAGLTLLGADRFRVALDVAVLRVDALEVERLGRSSVCRDLEEMAALYQGDFLEGLPVRDPAFDEWLAVERARLRALVCHAVERGLRQCIEDNDREGLEVLAEALLRLEPAHEEAHRALIRHYGERGDLAAAVRQYQACREALARWLDLQPTPETEALLSAVRTVQHSRVGIPPPPSRPVVSPSWHQLRTTLAIEPKALVLGDLTDHGLAAAVAAALREVLARVRWLSVLDQGIWLPTHGPGFEPAGLASPRYGVSISVLRANARIRLSAELKETATAQLLWAHHYDRGFADDVFDLVDEVATKLAATLDREVHLAETTRVMRQPTEMLTPYDYIRKSIPLIFEMSPESFAEAGRMLNRALADDPHEPLAYAWRAFWGCVQLGQGWTEDATAARDEVDWLVRRALELDPKSPFALAIAGHAASFNHHDYATALGYFDQSLKLDPNSPHALDLSAITQCYVGNPEEALRRLHRYEEIWPYDPHPYFHRTTTCIALALAGRYEQAVQLGRRTLQENSNFHAPYRPLIASLGQCGRIDEAREHLSNLRQRQPDFTIGWFREHYPPLREDDRIRYIEGLRKAGVPEN